MLSHKVRAFSTVFGSVLLAISLGTFYTLGTLSPYVTSYLRLKVDPHFTDSYMIWVNGFFMLGDGVLMPLGGYLAPIVGNRVVAFVGCLIFSGVTALASYCLTKGFIQFCITYGFVAWIGGGITSAVFSSECMRWFPARKGLVASIVYCGLGAGGAAFNAFQTAYINPGNLELDKSGIYKGYFTNEALLARVPRVFWITAIITIVFQVLGTLMIFTAPFEKPLEVPSLSVKYEANASEIIEVPPNIQKGLSPKQLFYEKEFYILWVIFAFHMMPVSYLITYYKNYGLTFIADDHFLSTIGAIGTLFSCVGKLSFGVILDKTSYKLSLAILSVGISATVQVLYATQFIRAENSCKAFYGIIVCLGYVFVGGIYSIIAAVAGDAFGLRHVGANCGLLFSSQAIGSFGGAFLAQAIQQRFLWTWPSFTSVVAFSVVSLILCTFLKTNGK